MIVSLLFALLVLLAVVDLKKAVLIYAPLKLFFNSNVVLLSSTRLSFDAAICGVFFVLWIFQRKKYQKVEPFPIKGAFIIYGLAYALSCVYPQYAISLMPDVICSVLLYSFVFFKMISSQQDIKLVLKAYIYFSFILCGNGLLQLFLGINPLDDMIRSWRGHGLGFFSDNDLSRMGLEGRVRSFIPHAITYGVACLCISLLILYFCIIKKNLLKPYTTTLLSVLLLLSGVIFCGSRTPILGLIPIVLLYKYLFKYLRKSFFIVAIGVAIGIYFFYDYFVYTFNSLFDEDVAVEAGGSNLEMRMGQLYISWNMLMKAPFFGNGGFYDMLTIGGVEMFGAESVWFPIMAKKGFVGIISYVILYIGAFKMTKSLSYRMLSISFIISWLIMRTATSFVGLDDSMLFIILILLYKAENTPEQPIKSNNNAQRRVV